MADLKQGEIKKPVIPIAIRRLIADCSRGQKLCLTRRQPDENKNGRSCNWWLSPTGKTVPSKVAEDAISRGFFVSNCDGLFGDAQTYDLKGERP